MLAPAAPLDSQQDAYNEISKAKLFFRFVISVTFERYDENFELRTADSGRFSDQFLRKLRTVPDRRKPHQWMFLKAGRWPKKATMRIISTCSARNSSVVIFTAMMTFGGATKTYRDLLDFKP